MFSNQEVPLSEWHETVYKHITTAAFNLEGKTGKENGGKDSGNEIFDVPTFCFQIRRAIPLFEKKMGERQLNDIRMKLINDVASELKLECLVDGKEMCKRKVEDTQRLCFEAILVMLYTKRIMHSYISTKEEFFARYPEFAGFVDLEWYTLMVYRNVMVTAIKLLPSASGHKNHLLDLVTRITEGHTVKYKTGSGETKATKNRVLIFRREGEVQPVVKKKKLDDTTPAPDAGVKRACLETNQINDNDKNNLFHNVGAFNNNGDNNNNGNEYRNGNHNDYVGDDEADLELEHFEGMSELGDASIPCNDIGAVSNTSSSSSSSSFSSSLSSSTYGGLGSMMPSSYGISGNASAPSPWDSLIQDTLAKNPSGQLQLQEGLVNMDGHEMPLEERAGLSAYTRGFSCQSSLLQRQASAQDTEMFLMPFLELSSNIQRLKSG